MTQGVRGRIVGWAAAATISTLIVAACSSKSDDGDGDGDDGAAGSNGDGDGDGDGGGDGDGDGDGDQSSGGAANVDCSVTDPAEGRAVPEFASGTRLKARVASAAGMPDTFVGFFDSQLGVPCTFETASDGELRCLPLPAAGARNIGYSDSGCTDPIYEAPAGCSSASGYVRVQSGPCPDHYAVRQLQALANPADGYRGNPEDCQADGQFPADGEHFSLSAPLDPTDFVAGTLRNEPGACAALVRVVDSEDGASAPLSIETATAGIACASPQLEGDATLCNPANKAYMPPHFSDDACTAPLEVAETSTPAECAKPDVASQDTDEWRLVGDPFDGEAYTQPSCGPSLEKVWIGALYELGESVAVSEIPLLGSQRVGEERLQTLVATEGDVALTFQAAGRQNWVFFDRELDSLCSVHLFDDDVYRCVPSLFGDAQYWFDDYIDSECTQPIVRCDQGCDNIGYPDRGTAGAACSTEFISTQVFATTTEIGAADEFYTGSPGACQMASTFGAPPAWHTGPVDLDTLPVVEVTVAD